MFVDLYKDLKSLKMNFKLIINLNWLFNFILCYSQLFKRQIMFIKLETKKETNKAYQLNNGSWIPKSILDDRGLKHPYYKVEDWWVSKSYHKMIDEQDENIYKTFKGIEPIVIKMRDIPNDVRNYWSRYWSGYSDYTQPDYEPRMWGNDCFEGEMSSRF